MTAARRIERQDFTVSGFPGQNGAVRERRAPYASVVTTSLSEAVSVLPGASQRSPRPL
jgi:hypothetical protein